MISKLLAERITKFLAEKIIISKRWHKKFLIIPPFMPTQHLTIHPQVSIKAGMNWSLTKCDLTKSIVLKRNAHVRKSNVHTREIYFSFSSLSCAVFLSSYYFDSHCSHVWWWQVKRQIAWKYLFMSWHLHVIHISFLTRNKRAKEIKETEMEKANKFFWQWYTLQIRKCAFCIYEVFKLLM